MRGGWRPGRRLQRCLCRTGFLLERVEPIVGFQATRAPCGVQACSDIRDREQRPPALALTYVYMLVQAACFHTSGIARDDDVTDGGGGKSGAAGDRPEPRAMQEPRQRWSGDFQYPVYCAPSPLPQGKRQQGQGAEAYRRDPNDDGKAGDTAIDG